MSQRKEALRAPMEVGPRAALTQWGAPEVPEGGEKHGQSVDVDPQPPAQLHTQWGYWALARSWLVSRNETDRKLVQNCPDSRLTLQPIGGPALGIGFRIW